MKTYYTSESIIEFLKREMIILIIGNPPYDTRN